MRTQKVVSWGKVTQIVFCILLSACAIPHPMTKRTEGVGKAELAAQPDVSQIKVGLTSRTEVLEKFALVKVWTNGRLFLGRWTHSGMGISGDRLWWARNLLVQFDDASIVQRYAACSDSDLLEQLPSYLDPKSAISDLAKPVRNWVQGEDFDPKEHKQHNKTNPTPLRDIQLEIQQGVLKFDDITVTREQIIELTVPHLLSVSPNPARFNLEIHFREKVHQRKKLWLITDAPTFVLLVEFMQPWAATSNRPSVRTSPAAKEVNDTEDAMEFIW